MKKPSLQSVVKKTEPAATPKAAAPATKKAAASEVNPARGERGDFLKLTVTLSPDAYGAIMAEVTRRKVAKEPDPNISAILREAVMQYLGKGV